MSNTNSTSKIQPHGFMIKPENFAEQKVLAVYLPSEMIQFLHSFSFEYRNNRFTFSDFRTIIEGLYPSIISIHLSPASIQGEDPWMYLTISSQGDVEVLYWEFYRWIEGCLEDDDDSFTLLPSSVKHAELPYHEIEVSSLFSQDNSTFISFMKGYLSSAMIERKIPTHFGQVGTDVLYPTTWYKSHNGKSYEVVSKPITLPIKTKTEQKASIVCRFDIIYTLGEWHVHVYFSLRRWLIGLHPNKQFHFNPMKKSYDKRSFYIMNPTWSAHHMLRLSIEKKGKSARYTHERTTLNWLKKNRLELDDLDTILTKLPDYQNPSLTMVLIPYLSEDKGKNGNHIDSGLNIVDHYNLFCLTRTIFPTFTLLKSPEKLNKTNWDASNMSTSYKDGKVRVDISEKQKEYLLDKAIHIHVYSTRKQIKEELQSAIANLFNRKQQKGSSNYKIEQSPKQKNKFNLIAQSDDGLIPVLPDFSVEFVYHSWDSELFGPMLCESSSKHREAILERKDRVKQLGTTFPSYSHALIEIGEYDGFNAHTDPKQAIKLGFLDNHILTQCFYGKDETIEHRLISSLQDIFATRGFLNQHIQSYEEVLNKYVFYMPYLLEVGKGRKMHHIYTIARFYKGVLHVRYEETDWLTLDESIAYLTIGQQRKISKHATRSFTLFWKGLVHQIDNIQPIVIFDRKNYTKSEGDDHLSIVTYELNTHNVPYISYFRTKEVPSKGTFLAKTLDGYYSVASKMPTDTNAKNSVSKLENNKLYVNRLPMKLQFQSYEGDVENQDQIVYAVHLLRNITVTFESFVNHPYPLHMLKHHHETLLF
ncbi:hypothetical protein [Cytobacillus sp. IB215316]|uniref:hypothetical protein n=1 Tax=Cytobacillus sp. IB215316 TaxID=3097354 RepID=UPI002A14C806|nr:hypothetical protein [Cytobacillus sp. IB215316]MDX8359844.1 hypothetical protein [Cytobacillus sp. IB215316]